MIEWCLLLIFAIFIEFLYSYRNRKYFNYKKKLYHTAIISFLSFLIFFELVLYDINFYSIVVPSLTIIFIIDRYICKKS